MTHPETSTELASANSWPVDLNVMVLRAGARDYFMLGHLTDPTMSYDAWPAHLEVVESDSGLHQVSVSLKSGKALGGIVLGNSATDLDPFDRLLYEDDGIDRPSVMTRLGNLEWQDVQDKETPGWFGILFGQQLQLVVERARPRAA